MQAVQNKFTALGLAGLLAFSAACAGSGEPDVGATPDDFAVLVNNNAVPTTSVTVFIQPDVGARQLLGTVDPNARRTFDDFAMMTNRFRLVAQTMGGNTIVSEPVLVGGAEVVRWDLALNTIFLDDTDG